jgi:hypothetical protein
VVDSPAVVELAWNRSPGAEGCIDRATLGDKVEQIVGRGVFARDRADATIRGTIGPGPGGRGWLAVVEARSEGTTTLERELTLSAADCRELDEALVLVVALMVDSSEKRAPLVLPAPAERTAVAIGPEVVVAYGMLPGAGLGLGLVSEVRVPPVWPMTLSTHFWPTWPSSQALLGGSGGQFGAWTVGVAICPLTSAHPDWTAYGCASGAGGVVYSTGVQLDISFSTTRPYAQAGLLAGLRFRLAGPLFGSLEIEGAVPFSHDSYSYTQNDGTMHRVFQTAAVVPIGHARLEVRVP